MNRRKIVVCVLLALHVGFTLVSAASRMRNVRPVARALGLGWFFNSPVIASFYRQNYIYFVDIDQYDWQLKVFSGSDRENPLYCSCRPGAGNRERIKVPFLLQRLKRPNAFLEAYARYWAKNSNSRSVHLLVEGTPLSSITTPPMTDHPVGLNETYEFENL